MPAIAAIRLSVSCSACGTASFPQTLAGLDVESKVVASKLVKHIAQPDFQVLRLLDIASAPNEFDPATKFTDRNDGQIECRALVSDMAE